MRLRRVKTLAWVKGDGRPGEKEQAARASELRRVALPLESSIPHRVTVAVLVEMETWHLQVQQQLGTYTSTTHCNSYHNLAAVAPSATRPRTTTHLR
jgi:hypothetical protein